MSNPYLSPLTPYPTRPRIQTSRHALQHHSFTGLCLTQIFEVLALVSKWQTDTRSNIQMEVLPLRDEVVKSFFEAPLVGQTLLVNEFPMLEFRYPTDFNTDGVVLVFNLDAAELVARHLDTTLRGKLVKPPRKSKPSEQ